MPCPYKEDHVRKLFGIIYKRRVCWARLAKARREAQLRGDDDDEEEEEESDHEDHDAEEEESENMEEDDEDGDSIDSDEDKGPSSKRHRKGTPDCLKKRETHADPEEEGEEEEEKVDDELIELPSSSSSSFGMAQKREQLRAMREEIAKLRVELLLD